MTQWTRRGFIGSLSAAAAATAFAAPQKGNPAIKITDLRCAIIGKSPVVRIVTDQGVSGYGEAESYKPYLKPMVLFYKDYLLGEDPTDVARVMLKIRRLGAFKPWGAAVSAIEIGPCAFNILASAQSSINAPRIDAIPRAARKASRRTSMQPPAAAAVERRGSPAQANG